MEKWQYIDRLGQLRKEAQEAERQLAIEYATSNNPYKVGDKVTDHIGTILIEKIQVTSSSSIGSDRMPYCVYFGIELKKDGTPKKGNPRTQVHQINVSKK